MWGGGGIGKEPIPLLKQAVIPEYYCHLFDCTKKLIYT